MENKHLEWINTGQDLQSDQQMLEDFASWIDRFHPSPRVEWIVREGWESVKHNPVAH